LAEESDIGRVAAKVGDKVVDPFECADLVAEAVVADTGVVGVVVLA
jgi:hypothetical protein